MKVQEQFKRDFALKVKSVAESIEEAARDDYEGLAKYFDDCLDVDFIVGGHLEYRGARVMLCCGNPNIYFDTREGWVQGYWDSEFNEYHVQSWATNAVDEYFEKQFACLRDSY